MRFWQDKVVLVTGGSAGLGLEIARAASTRGARVAVVARNAERIAAAVAELNTSAPLCSGFVCDVTDTEQVADMTKQVLRRFGFVNVLINNVGASTRRTVIEAEQEEYRRLLELNFMSAVNVTRALLPTLVRQRGSIVNIGSLASKTGWPLIAPYAVGKAALGAYTHQLRLELSPQVHVMLVCPGPFKGSDASARYGGTEGLPLAAQLPGAGARVAKVRPDWLAKKILHYCERRRAELIVPFHARLLFAVAQVSPRLGDWLLKRMAGAAQARVDPVDFFRSGHDTFETGVSGPRGAQPQPYSAVDSDTAVEARQEQRMET